MSENNVVQLFEEKVVSMSPVDGEETTRKVFSKETSEKKMDKAEKSFKFEADNATIEVKDGHDFLKKLKKEANRQKSMKSAEHLMQQALDVEFLPTVESVSEEITLADSFEITEED